jgi:hypothetical protein
LRAPAWYLHDQLKRGVSPSKPRNQLPERSDSYVRTSWVVSGDEAIVAARLREELTRR